MLEVCFNQICKAWISQPSVNCSRLAFLSVDPQLPSSFVIGAGAGVCRMPECPRTCRRPVCALMARTSLFWGGSVGWYWCLTFRGLSPCSLSSTEVWYSFGKTKWLCPSYFPLFREILVEPREKRQPGTYKHIDWTWHGENISLRMSLSIFPVFGKCSFVFKAFGFRKQLLLSQWKLKEPFCLTHSTVPGLPPGHAQALLYTAFAPRSELNQFQS